MKKKYIFQWYLFSICKSCYRIVGTITVSASWVEGKSESLIPVYSDDTLGFTVALKEIVELKILFEEKDL